MKSLKCKMWGRIGLVLCLFWALAIQVCNRAEMQKPHPKVLFLSSYAYDWASVPYQIKGVNSVLENKVEMEYVFMNTKKYSYNEVKDKVKDEIQGITQKAGKFDAIIAEDDAALDFVLEKRQELFSNIPVVFMGINTMEKAKEAHLDPLITGMVEAFPYHDTIALAAKLYPKATQVVGISDNSESGRGVTKRFFAEAKTFPELKFQLMNASELTADEMKNKLSSLKSQDTILIFLSLVEDKNKKLYTLTDATNFVEQNAPVPQFKADMLGIGQGVFGGFVSSYEEMGKTAGKQLLEILQGTYPGAIPVNTMGGYPMFDQHMLDKFKVDAAQLPEDSVIINHVPGFYEQHKMIIWPATVFVLLLLFGFAMYLANNRKHHSQQLELLLDKADVASRAKSDFLARMSHEIRTPMNVIIGEATIAQLEKDTSPKVKECLEKIMLSSHHLLNLINDILDMSAIESKKLKIATARFDIKEIINTVTAMYYSQCKNKGITFEVRPKNMEYEFLEGDQLRTQQIILNLLSNALKFTPKGGTIVFGIEEYKAEGAKIWLHMHVSDTGCGMSPEYMQRIFQPFEQASALTAKEHGGSGLGLAISKNFAELLGGTLDVESTEGKGTTFTLDAPYRISPDQQEVAPSAFETLRAIIADDDVDALEYAGSIMKNIGISYDIAHSGADALQKITKGRNERTPYDICFLDWKMKDISGVELTRKVRIACGDHPVVVIASAYDLNEIREEAKEAGVDQCLTKPLFQSSVFNLLMNLSNGRLVRETGDAKAYDFAGKKILLAEDIDLNREIAMSLLEMVNFTVDTAEDGQQAADKFAASSPGTYAAILMDIQMPNMNGYEATAAIRGSNHPDAKTVPIIAMTANAFTEDIAKSLNSGMNDHVSKPIDTKLLYEVLDRQLNKNK